MSLTIDTEVKAHFPDLHVLVRLIENVTVKSVDPRLETFKEEVVQRARSMYDTESLKDKPVFRAYRDFFWAIKVDPTKNRPAAEALIRRVVGGKPLPRINTLVDTYNLASIETEIAIAAFDADKLRGNLTMHYAEKDEKFLGIGMKEPLLLQGGEIVISDEEKMVAIYPHRDAEETKVTEATRNILLLFCGAPGISQEHLQEAMKVASGLITKFCDGKVKT